MVGMDELWQAMFALSIIIISIGLAWLMLELQGRSDRHRHTDKQERKET